MTIIPPNPIILLILSQFLSFNFSTKTEAFFSASLESTIQDPQALNKGAQSRLGKKESSDWIRLEAKKETYLNIEKRNFQREKKPQKATMWYRLLLMFFRIWLYMKEDRSVIVIFEDSYK